MKITKSRLAEIITEEAHQMGVLPEVDTEYKNTPNKKYDDYFGNDLTLGNIRAIVQETIEEQIKNEFKRVYERISALERTLADKANIKPEKAPKNPTVEPSKATSSGTIKADDWQMSAMKDNAAFPLSTAPDYEKKIAALKAKYSKGAK
jgi:hypothetical protein